MFVTVIGNVVNGWEVWVHLNQKEDPRQAGEAFIIGSGKTLEEAKRAAKATLDDAQHAIEELLS